MREIVLDGNEMKTTVEMHDYLKNSFLLPYYYARNLDSLYQILVKETDPMKVTMINKESISLGYGDALVLLFHDLCAENHNYSFELKD